MKEVGMLVGQKVRLRPKRIEDAQTDYNWRKDPELADLDASSPLDESFEDYRRGYSWELEHPAKHRRRFAIETLEGKHIGNCAYFDIDEVDKTAQFGIMVGDRDYWGKGYGTEATKVLMCHIFTAEDIQTVYLRTLRWNVRGQKSFSKVGFIPIGELREGHYDFVIMRLTRERWEEVSKEETCSGAREK